MERFEPSVFLPERVVSLLTDVRVTDPERIQRVATKRERRSRVTVDGRLNVLAADHPARRVTGVGDDPLAMADRHGYLARIVRVLLANGIDGVMASMDILEDLLILDDLLREAGAPSLLDGKLVIASLNRGGLAGAAWELDDRMTGPSPEDCVVMGLDGGKLLLRLCDDEPGALRTLVMAAQAIKDLNSQAMACFLEPVPVTRAPSGYQVNRDPGALARTVGVAAALGDSSRHLWLKLPYCAGFEAVARATTLPILLLGGDATGDPAHLLEEISAGMAAGSNVRGAMAGRNVLYPGDDDPLAIGGAIGAVVHGECSAEEAMAGWSQQRCRNMDAISRYL